MIFKRFLKFWKKLIMVFRTQISLENLWKAIKTLEESIKYLNDEKLHYLYYIIRDSVIQRFEYTVVTLL
jgi:hypothetical protein